MDFDARLGERFTLGVDCAAAGDTTGGNELELIEVRALGSHGGPPGRGRSEPFSCLFRGPVESPLAQGTHTLLHPELGRVELFLVPVGPADGGLTYEAIFA